jgi:hypothetical protein
MRKTGLIILIGSLLGAVGLFLLWIVGFIFHVGGGLIHLLLILAPLLGFLGGITGLILVIVGKK